MTATPTAAGTILVPLNKLKKSPKNARRTPHTEAAIAALAASIGAKRQLQPLVVEPETDAEGRPTGSYLVTIGEGRRLAQRLRAKRREIRKTEPIPCVVETSLDAGEISLDENVTRSSMHPADEFEAFRDLAERRGYGPEEIAARFGVSPDLVRRRLRLAAVSPRLIGLYRAGELTLDQLMAFAVSDDAARQEQVFDQLPPTNRSPSAIRRAMTEAHVGAQDKRARFVGLDAYAAAGGVVVRDLFTEDGGGWLADVPLLDRLAAEKLEALAREVREREGWKWSEAYLDYPHGYGCARVYPVAVARSEAELDEIEAVSVEYDALTETWGQVEDLPPEVAARLDELDAKLQAWGDGYAYRPEDVARAGVLAALSFDGTVRLERGFVRPEDMPAEEPEPGEEAEGADDGGAAEPPASAEDEPADAPLSDRLKAELTAHRTAALRDALAERPDDALLVVLHAAVLSLFHGRSTAGCADIRFLSAQLGREAPGIEDTPAGRRIAERHEAWAREVPEAPEDAWAFVCGLDGDSRSALLAHCVGLTVNGVHGWERRVAAWAHADAVAARVALDMTAYWRPTAVSYFGRVTKARIVEAVREAAGEAAADGLAGLTRIAMGEAAERLVADTGWLPALLRTGPDAAPASSVADELAA